MSIEYCTIANQTEYAQFTSCLPMVSGSLRLHLKRSLNMSIEYCTIANQTEYAQFTSCLPMVSGSLRLPPPLKRVAMIELKYC
jgi:hypothetical protein